MSVSYDYYRIFYYVGKYGSFTRAAKILRNNQPNITRAMNNLESELDCKLFYRSRKGVTLTPEGEKLFTHVESAYRQLRLGESEIAAGRKLQSGHLSIAVSEIALHTFILPVLQQYQNAYPEIHIEILNHSTTQGIKAVSQGIVDLAVVSTPTGVTRPLQEIKVQSFQEILIAGRRYADLADRKLSLHELTGYPLICLGKDTKTYEFYNHLFTANGLILAPAIEAATTDQILPMVQYDIGLGFVPYEFAREALEKGDILRLQLTETIPARHICLIRDKSRPLSAAAAVFEEMVISAD